MKEILRALDDKLTGRELDGIIAEIDTDGSGTVDFDGKFQNVASEDDPASVPELNCFLKNFKAVL